MFWSGLEKSYFGHLKAKFVPTSKLSGWITWCRLNICWNKLLFKKWFGRFKRFILSVSWDFFSLKIWFLQKTWGKVCNYYRSFTTFIPIGYDCIKFLSPHIILWYGFYLLGWSNTLFYIFILYSFGIASLTLTLVASFCYYSSMRRNFYHISMFIVAIYVTSMVYIYNFGLNPSVSLHIELPSSYIGIFLKKMLLSFKIDLFSICFSGTTLTISFFVLLYSESYMLDNVNKKKFDLLIKTFTLSMVFFFHSVNFLTLFFFWEMIGITSFLLIGYFTTKLWGLKSALKAFFFNKLSDVFLLLSVVFYYLTVSTLNLTPTNIHLLTTSTKTFTIFNFFIIPTPLLIGLCILTAASIKSALLFSHSWLPDSMEAPVPASALIHSSTLVSAGIYLLYIFKPLFLIYPKLILFIYAWVTLTIIVCSLTALYQEDFKRLLAFSTISNCSILIISVFISDELNVINYFMVHGYAKALLFLIIGYSFIQNKHQQDGNKQFLSFEHSNVMIALIPSLLFLSFSPLTSSAFLKQDIFARLVVYGYIYPYLLFFSIKVLSLMYTLKLLHLFYKNGVIGFNKRNSSKIFLKANSTRLLFVIYCMCFFMLLSIYFTSGFSGKLTYPILISYRDLYNIVIKWCIFLAWTLPVLYYKIPNYLHVNSIFIVFYLVFYLF